MKKLDVPEGEKELARGEEAFNAGDLLGALHHLERGLAHDRRPGHLSMLGFCIARERGQYRKGIELCREALAAEPENPLHYLNLGKILILSGNRGEAIDVFRRGMADGGSPDLRRQLEEMGTRKPAPIPFLHRDHPLNKCLGKLLAKVGLR